MTRSARRAFAAAEAPYWHVNTMTAAVLLLTHAIITIRLAEDVRTVVQLLVLVVIVLVPGWSRSWAVWTAFTGVLVFELLRAPFAMPNHHFTLTWIALALAVSLSAPDEERAPALRAGARWMVVAVMGMATLQKLTSSEFMSGSYIGYVLASGGFGQPLLALCESCRTVAASNGALVAEFRSTVPAADASVLLASPFPALPALASAFGLLILAFEAWLAVAFAALPGRRLTHWSLIAFALGLGVLRAEYLFIGVVCLLGLLSCPQERILERRVYALAALVFAAGSLT